jgi:hypothetical protein
MNARKRVTCGVFIIASLGGGAALHATETGVSIGLNTGAVVGGGGPSGSSSAIPAGGKAGVPAVQQTNWNDLFPGSGTQSNLILDNAGTAVPTSASVTWVSQGPSDPGGNDHFDSSTSGPPAPQNFELYQGYLDTDDNTTSRMTVQGLPASFAAGYDLYVYFLGSTSARGGTYGVGPVFTPPGDNPNAVPSVTFQPNKLLNAQTGTYDPDLGFVASGPQANGPAFIEDPGASFTDIGNFAVFRGLTATDFTLFATTVGDRTYGFGDRERAPISAIQMVANPVPEPTAFALVAVGALGILGRRRRA